MPENSSYSWMFIYLLRYTYILWIQQICVGAVMVSTEFHVLSLLWHLWCYGGEGVSNSARNSASVVKRRTATLSFTSLHRLWSGVVKSGLCGGHNIGEGDVAEPRPINWRVFHWGVQAKSAVLPINGFGNHCWNDVITWFILWPVLNFYAPKNSLSTAQRKSRLYLRL